MDKQTIIDNEFATLLYYPDQGIVYHTFHKPLSGKEFRDVLEAGTKLIQEQHATKWLSDDRENSALTSADTDWGLNDWFPRTIQAGWKYWAMVVPRELVGRLSIKEVMDSYVAQGIERIMVFTNPNEAMNWLLRQ